MSTAVVFVTLALLLYTIAIWSERLKRTLQIWMVVVFALGLICDITGTTMMAFNATRNTLSLHTFCGYFALVIMLGHLLWAIQAIKKSERAKKLFHKWSIFAWFVWVAAFITGIPWNIII